MSKVYQSSGGDVVALEDLDLEVGKGGIFGIIGMNGAGKSTLIRCINLLERPTAGSIGVDVREITRHEGVRLKRAARLARHDFSALQPAHAEDGRGAFSTPAPRYTGR